jgi:hypothetical protein
MKLGPDDLMACFGTPFQVKIKKNSQLGCEFFFCLYINGKPHYYQ